MRSVYWLASYPKSGNTWVRMMLTAYVYGAADINRAGELILGDNQPYAYHVVSPVPLNDLTPGEVRHLRSAALMHMAARHPHTPVILKTHNANMRVGSVDLIPHEMTAGAVYIVRDPRDVLVSYAEHIGQDYDGAAYSMSQLGASLDQRSTGIYHYLADWSTNVKGWAEAQFPVVMVKYEDMLADPALELERILTGLGFDPDPDRIAGAVEAADFRNLAAQEEQEGFQEASRKAERFFNRGTSGGWRDALTREQAAKIEAVHDYWMQFFGYDPEVTTQDDRDSLAGELP